MRAEIQFVYGLHLFILHPSSFILQDVKNFRYL